MTTQIHPILFPLLRRLSDGAFHSGEALAGSFGVSRATVCNVLSQAEAMGLTIHAVRGRGYRLPARVEWLDHATVADALGEAAAAFDLRVVDSVSSTNSDLMTAAGGGAADGTVLCAEHQQAGRGRRGRRWHGVLGGSLTFSVLWRFEGGLQALAGLSLAVGLAVARALGRHTRHPVRLKWPNDVLVDYRKLAGILVEVQGDIDGAAWAVVGVGLNVRLDEAQRDAVDQAVVDLAEMGVTVDRNVLLADCLRELSAVISTFRRGGFAPLRADWMALDAYAGRPVSLVLPNTERLHGVGAGVDEQGGFLLRDAAEAIRVFSGGEVSLRLAGRRP